MTWDHPDGVRILKNVRTSSDLNAHIFAGDKTEARRGEVISLAPGAREW